MRGSTAPGGRWREDAPPAAAPAVFVSYRRGETRHLAGRLADQLSTRFRSAKIYLDVDTIAPGVDVVPTIREFVRSSDILVALIGPTWTSRTDEHGRRRLDIPGDIVVLEIQTALENGIQVVPVLVDGAEMPTTEQLPQPIQELAGINATRLDHDDFRRDLERLFPTIEASFHKRGARRRSRPSWAHIATGLVAVALLGIVAVALWLRPPPLDDGTTGREYDVVVEATLGWQASRVHVQPGDTVSITSEGTWGPFGEGLRNNADGCGPPYCTNGQEEPNNYCPCAIHAALIAKIGPDGEPFLVGRHLDLNPTDSGELHFRINDSVLGDNDGELRLTLARH